MEIGDRWSRRQFVGATADVAAVLALDGVYGTRSAVARPAEKIITFFDPRFPQSQRRALDMAGAGHLVATNGDPTAAAYRLLTTPMLTMSTFQGVTTESVPFCLRHFLPSAPFSQRRLDRDLFIWTFQRS